MKADPTTQAALLTIVDLDNKTKMAENRLRALPEHDQLNALNVQRRTLADAATAAQTKASDGASAMRRIEEDLVTARTRLHRDQQRIDDGVVNDARSIASLQDEIAHLTERINSLEDNQLELMMTIEEDETAADKAKAAKGDVEGQMRALLASRDASSGTINDEIAGLKAQRQKVVAGIPPELVVLYDKAASRGGGGAAELKAGRCTGCGLMLDALARRAAEDAPVDDVVRCEECGRILVRR